jgi:transcriptional regulator with XRE-family HTH domain
MDPKQFGKLIAALRREQRDEQDRECTQARLAETAGLSEQIIGKIERGEKVTYEADLLINLAKAFRLSSRERKEFFLAAVGLAEKDIPRPANTPEKILTSLITIMETTALPAFIVDAYDDVVAINPLALALFDFTEDMQKEAPRLVGGYNVMRVVFSKKSPYREALAKEQRERYITQNLQFFKTITLPHRASPYFTYLMKGFRKDKDMSLFNAYYAESANDDHDDFYIEDEVLNINHEKLGQLRCYSPSMAALTPVGNLYLLTEIPADQPTLRIFSRLALTCGTGALRLASWPQKLEA